MLKRILAVLLVSALIVSCASKPKEPQVEDSNGTYFSIGQFIQDQFATYKGQPFTFEKIVTMNGKTDSTLTNVDKMDWGAILQPFFESDISDKKYLGQYNFSQFEENITATLNYYYEAKNNKLFTRKLQISVDDMSHKVKSIYIETEKNSQWSHTMHKLFYVPLKVISIQEIDHSRPAKELHIEYRFL